MAYKLLVVFFALVIILGIVVSYSQERLIFFPEKLPKDFKFLYLNPFKEYFIPVDKKTKIHGLLFKAQNPKGLVFFLHGNAGSNSTWGLLADFYLENQYDFFVPDYRGYGKSDGKITSEKQLLGDVQIAFDTLKKEYEGKKIVIIGFSIGSGPAAYLASKNDPSLLALQAPYYNFPDLAKKYFQLLPKFLVRYKFRTDQYIQQVKCPVVIFHGDRDEIIYTGSSEKLKQHFKPGDKLFILKAQPHNGINENPDYQKNVSNLLRIL
jgi:alpha-beta hydrolase superfamily lysophospholipase